jgi:uncharacterized protein YfaS (alpha-2-macroglobulin family)
MRMLRPLGLAFFVALGFSTASKAQAPEPPQAPERGPAPFAVTGVDVQAERDTPQACFTFNRALEKSRLTDYAAQVEIDPPIGVSVMARNDSLCLDGFSHGAKYAVTLKQGLPGAQDVSLAEPARYEIEVPNRKPALAFRGAGYILPHVGSEGLPLRTVNVKRARLQVLRINDRSLVEQVYYGRISHALTDLDIGGIVERSGEQVWQGEMAIGEQRNQVVVTPFPVDAAIGALKPGVYIAVAGNADREGENWEAKATQWFVITDLGLTTFAGQDGLLVFARSLTTAEPMPGVELRLLARSNAELGKLVTGPDGIARFPAETMRGTGGNAPQAVFAYGASGDMGFLDVAARSETMEGVAAAPVEANGPLDAYLYTDRSLYQPGETVFLSGLLRDADAVAVQGRPLTLKIQRPDGFEVDRRQVTDAGGGSYAFGLDIPRPASTGQWSVTAHLEPDGEPIGRADFVVEDFVPPRLSVGLSSDRESLEPGGVAALKVDGRYRRAGAAAKLPGEVTMLLRPAGNPYPKYQGYRFGLVQEALAPIKADAPGFITGPDGSAKVELRLPELPDTTHQLEAVVQGKLYDIGGRPSVKEITLPVRHQPFSIGIKPRFQGDAVPEGATAAFDVMALDPAGNPIDKPALSYELFEEDNDYAWFEAGGHWDYRIQVKDKRLTGGTVAVAGEPRADAKAAIEQPVGSGRYRLEVFDPGTGVATSVRFSAGWWVNAAAGDRPDRVEVAVMMPKYSGGETARVFVRPPYQAQVLVTVADRRVHQTMIQQIGPDGAFLEVPVDPLWTAGVHVIATAFAPADATHKVASRRAVGTGWLAVDSAPRRLGVAMTAPQDIVPRRRVSVPVKVTGAEEGAQVRLTVSAVDDAMLQLTEFAAPDPVAHYLGRRPLAVDVRDVRGRLVEQDQTVPLPRVKPVVGAAVRRRAADPVPRRREMTALYSGIVTLEPDGMTEVPLDIPDFDGRLRLMAVAWTPAKVGNAVVVATVRDPVLADLSMPRFLSPGDTAQATLTLNDRGQKPGDYAVKVSTGGAIALQGDGQVTVPPLKPGKPVSVPFTITGNGVGAGSVMVDITGPDGFSLSREWTIGVRRVQPATTRRQVELIEPGAKAEVAPNTVPELTALRRETVSVMLSAGTLPDLDLAGMLLALEKYPYGSAEQMTSRSMPLLQLAPVAAELGIASEEMVRNRVQRSIDRLMTVQRTDGAFAMWSAQGPAEMWLTAYVVDFLGRARDAGYRVPELPLRKGIEWLNAVLDNAWFDEAELAARAYALYTLAGAKAIDVAEARYFQETWWAALPTRMARAQIASALARLGDGGRAAEAFNQIERTREEPAGMRDFGSDLRDQAAVIALLAENNTGNRERLVAQTQQLATMLADAEATSTQEQAWVLMASAALVGKSAEMKLTVDGAPLTSNKPVYRRLDPGGAPVKLENTGSAPVWRAVTMAGVPVDPPSAASEGFRIERKVLDMDGKPFDPANVGRDRMLVVILEGESLLRQDHQALVVDMLPAGLEIENVRLADSGQLGDLSWLGTLSAVNHVEYRDDRFVAALELKPDQPAFRLVYLVRAVTPGDYAMPGAYVEDMYSPNLFARGAAGRLAVGAE